MEKILLLALALLPTVAQSIIIDSATTNTEFSSGQFANLQGLQWLTLDETDGKTRTTIEGGFGGFFDDGWRYASRIETESLLDSLWGGSISGWASDNYLGARWFIDTFNLSTTFPNSNITFTNFQFGNTFDCSTWNGYTCLGSVKTFENSGLSYFGTNTDGNSVLSYVSNSGQAGYFDEEYGLNGGFSTSNAVNFTYINSTGTGSLLVRSVAIPEPSVGFLLLSGLIFLGITRSNSRRKPV